MGQGITNVGPRWVIPGGRIVIEGLALPLGLQGPPYVQVGDAPAHVISASSRLLCVRIPDLPAGTARVHVEGVSGDVASVTVARSLTTGVHQVDSPAFDGLGRLYITHSGTRSAKAPISIFRLTRDGMREAVAADVANPTSLALGPDGAIYVSSRFEGQVYRLTDDDKSEVYGTELGVPTGLAFGPDGALFVGDRSGSVFRITSDRKVELFATLPGSVAAFHLAFGADGSLYVAAPTLASHDPIYRITPDRLVETACDGFGRPQGIAFDANGILYVADALAGASGLYRIDLRQEQPTPELVLAAPMLVGLAFDPDGGLLLASADTIWRLDVDLKPYILPHPG